MRLEYSLEQRQKMAQRCLAECRVAIHQLREAIGQEPHHIAPGVFAGVVALARDQVRDQAALQTLVDLLSSPDNQNYLLKNVGRVVSSLRDGWSGFAGEAVVDTLERNSDGNIVPPGDARGTPASRGRIIAALEAPDQTRVAIASESELLKTLAKDQTDTSGLVREISEKRSALSIAEELQPHRKLLATVLDLAFRIKNADREPILGNFFKEIDLMKGLDWQVSERIAKRFITRFRGLGHSSPGYEYGDAMMNTISEFVMVSLGIIQPELFQRMRGEVHEVDVLFLDQNIDDRTDGAVDVKQTMKKLSLVERGPIFWCRWAIPGIKLSVRTDEAIRRLQREVIGGSKEETLAAFGFKEFVEDLRTAKRELDREDALARFGELLCERLARDTFRTYLQDRCVRTWYPELKRFLDISRSE
jgi:hypothetical protein